MKFGCSFAACSSILLCVLNANAGGLQSVVLELDPACQSQFVRESNNVGLIRSTSIEGKSVQKEKVLRSPWVGGVISQVAWFAPGHVLNVLLNSPHLTT